MARMSTMTALEPTPRRAVLILGDTDTVLVARCTGTGPFTLTVRRVNRWDRLWWRIRARWRRMFGPVARRVQARRLSRCDEPGCRRRADPDTELNFYCARHGGMARSADEAI
jgi:hypothetical protein